MCSQGDDPTQYDAPEPIAPRKYVLSGSRPPEEPRVSVALAVLGEMLNEAENVFEARRSMYGYTPHPDVAMAVRITVLREARDRVAEAGG